jgi:hypothetical protein
MMADKIDTEGMMHVTGGISDNLNYFQPMTGVTIQQIKPSQIMTFLCGIKINLETGEVTIPEGMSLSEASRAFWEAVGDRYRPGFW